MTTRTPQGQLSEQVRAMAEAARLAPSVHNTQPWRLRALADGLAVHEDVDRALPVLDPRGRLRTISCGAAVLNAVVALAAAGSTPRVEILPEGPDSTLLAVVRAGPAHPPSVDDLADAAAVPRRRTHRRVHSPEPVDSDVLGDLERSVAREGARLTVVDRPTRRAVARLLARAVQTQAANGELVGEIDAWIRHWGSGEEPVDGIPVGSLGTAPYPVDSLVQEQTDTGVVRAEEVEEVLDTSTLVAISTSGDRRRDWLVAGMALERLLLRATGAGLVATFADQATQDPRTRQELAEVLDVLGFPQVVLRLGHPLVDVPPTPRRPLEELLT